MINKDFKSFNKQKNLFSKKKKPTKQIILASFAVIGLIGGIKYYSSDDTSLTNQTAVIDGELKANTLLADNGINGTESVNSKTSKLSITMKAPVVKSTKQELVAPEILEPAIAWKKIAVANGDNLALIFKKQGFSATDLHYLMKAGDDIKILKDIRPGHTIEFAADPVALLDDKTQFKSLRYSFSPSETLIVNKVAHKQFTTEIDIKPITFKERFATAKIESSFYNAGIASGLPDGVIMELAGVFEYDIDFALEIRKHDAFSVLYQEKYIDGKKVGYGDILSAEFVNQGDKYAAVQYTDLNNRTAYYTPDGKALRKSFLRAPLSFNYVSSSFNPRRFHPIQKRVKPHRGVDYRAATGTPVRASGDGRVVRSTYDKYNGHYVFVQHGNNIMTKYLHFSKRAVKKGQRVKQGQIIGYVGSTGMSQAPHLHYEFVVNGVHRNPRTVKLPHAAPVRKAELARFAEATKPLIGQLETERTNYFARLNTSTDSNEIQE